MTRIETATLCACGTHVVLDRLPTYALPMCWQASCPRCLDPVEDATEREKVMGNGASVDEALWDWQESHDLAWDVTWEPVTTLAELEQQVTAEIERQRGWARRRDKLPHAVFDSWDIPIIAEWVAPEEAFQ